MSIDLIIFLPTGESPKVEHLERELGGKRMFRGLEKDSLLVRAKGFHEIDQTDQFSNRVGLEIYPSEVTSQRIEDFLEDMRLFGSGHRDKKYLDVLRGSHSQITFSCQTDEEALAARRIALTLARMTGGWVYDPQADEWLTP